MPIVPYTIPFDAEATLELRKRLEHARLQEAFDSASWDYGTNLPYMKELLAYWKDSYDWEQAVSRLNDLPHFLAAIDGHQVHFIHQRSDQPGARTVVLIHGWPDSFLRFRRMLPLLTQAGEGGQSLNVVIPSIPGFGFSSKPVSQGWNLRASAELLAKLMEQLGYDTYFAVGGDGGSPIAQLMAHENPNVVQGVYLSDAGLHKPSVDQSEFTDVESKYFQNLERTSFSEGAYAMIQMTKPQTLAYALQDSPVGLAAWIIEKFHGWSDHDGNLEKVFTKDELLTNVMVYWTTKTIGSSIRAYREEMMQPSINDGTFLPTPTGFGLFPKELGGHPPAKLLERGFNVVHRTEFESGGHFTAMEQPEAMARDLWSFLANLQNQ